MVVVLIAIVAAFVLGGVGGYTAKTLSLPATSPAYHVVAGQGGASGTGLNSAYSTRRGGNLSVEGAAPAAASYREPGSRQGGPQAS
jgi:hypothetical protein